VTRKFGKKSLGDFFSFSRQLIIQDIKKSTKQKRAKTTKKKDKEITFKF